MTSEFDGKTVTIEGVRAPGAAIVHASYFQLTHVGGEIILDVGAIDDQQLVGVLKNPIETDEVVKAHVSHRFGMSPKSLRQLQSRVNELLAALKDS
jgi:hypothetical protein